MRDDSVAKNLAEVIVDLFHEDGPKREYAEEVMLVQHHIERAQWLAKKPLLEEIKRLREGK